MPETVNQEYGRVPADANDGEATSNIRTFEPLLDTEEAARLLRMHPRTLRTKARNGMIPAIQVGKRWRFRVSMLNHWLEEAS
jgi:excisionase family DNA binding protein